MAALSFSEEIKVLQSELDHTKQNLKSLESKYEQFHVQTTQLREQLNVLRQITKGKIPGTKPKRSKAQALDVNDQTGRPSRGARRQQIQVICKTLGRAGETFKTMDVIRELRQIESDVSAGMKSYTYAVLASLESAEFIKKVGRGQWQLV